MIPVKIKAERINFQMPIEVTEGAACYDVFCAHITRKRPDLVVCFLGFATEIAAGAKGVLIPRSGLTNELWAMLNSPGTIDEDYRGEWQMRFTYIGKNTNEVVGGEAFPEFPFKVGDRIGQMYFEWKTKSKLELVDELSETARGEGGFGHTGK